MLVITQDTERVFLQELEQCAKQPESWRCMIFRFSRMMTKPQGWFTGLLDKIGSCFGDARGRAFLFEDDDVHVLLPGGSKKGFAALIGQLAVMLAPARVEDMASIHEVQIDLQAIKNRLVERRQQAEPAEKTRDNTPPKSIFTDKAYYVEMTRTLAARRMKRSAPGILIVEDDPFSLRLVCKTLSQNYTLFTAQDGHAALESYLLNAPDVLFLDIGLPDMNGLELIDRILKADPAAYIVMLSGNGNRDNVVKAIENGAKGFVTKPFAREKLFYYIGKSPLVQQKLVRA